MKINNQELARISNLLSLAWSKETCYLKQAKSWNGDNSSLGQCAVTALVIQDYLGGRIAKMYVDKVSHYFNIVDEEIVDLTAKQFGDVRIDYSNYKIVSRSQILANSDTKSRYLLLRQKIVILPSKIDQK